MTDECQKQNTCTATTGITSRRPSSAVSSDPCTPYEARNASCSYSRTLTGYNASNITRKLSLSYGIPDTTPLLGSNIVCGLKKIRQLNGSRKGDILRVIASIEKSDHNSDNLLHLCYCPILEGSAGERMQDISCTRRLTRYAVGRGSNFPSTTAGRSSTLPAIPARSAALGARLDMKAI